MESCGRDGPISDAFSIGRSNTVMSADEDGTIDAPHTPHYDFNDAALPHGIAYWLSLVRQELTT